MSVDWTKQTCKEKTLSASNPGPSCLMLTNLYSKLWSWTKLHYCMSDILLHIVNYDQINNAHTLCYVFYLHCPTMRLRGNFFTYNASPSSPQRVSRFKGDDSTSWSHKDFQYPVVPLKDRFGFLGLVQLSTAGCWNSTITALFTAVQRTETDDQHESNKQATQVIRDKPHNCFMDCTLHFLVKIQCKVKQNKVHLDCIQYIYTINYLWF